MIDSHCHLNFDNLKKNIDTIIKNAIRDGVSSILSINTNPEEFNSHYNLISEYNSIFISYGQHPENVNSDNILSTEKLINFCNYKKVIGIGETGLDFHHSVNNKKYQYKLFENHIESSYKTNLPLIIHQRNSEEETIDVLNMYNKKKKLNAVFHCFTGTNKLKKFCLDNEFYISLSGIITFKNAIELRKVVKDFPIEWILVETDSPFLAPVPKRGTPNEPSNIIYIGKYLSNFYNISYNEITKTTNNNFYKLFSKAIKYNEIKK